MYVIFKVLNKQSSKRCAASAEIQDKKERLNQAFFYDVS